MRVKFWSENPSVPVDIDGMLMLMYLVVTGYPLDLINLAEDRTVVNTVVKRWFS
jgi:hypothetical protein